MEPDSPTTAADKVSPPQDLDPGLGWLAYTLDEALRLGLMDAGNLLIHVTPEVLAERLPRDLMVRVFASAFSTGKLTPEGILAVAPPATLVRHVAPAILWASERSTAERLQLDAALPSGRTPARQWLGGVIGQALAHGLMTPVDVLKHAPPATWVGEAPRDVVAGILAAGLSRPAFEPALVLGLLTPVLVGECVPTKLCWAMVDEAAERAFGLSGA